MADHTSGISDTAKQQLAAALGGSTSAKTNPAPQKIGTEQQIINIIEDATGIEKEEITTSSSLVEDLAVDSLTLVDIAVRLEEEFTIHVEDEVINSAGTVGQLVALVEQRLKAK